MSQPDATTTPSILEPFELSVYTESAISLLDQYKDSTKLDKEYPVSNTIYKFKIQFLNLQIDSIHAYIHLHVEDVCVDKGVLGKCSPSSS